MKSTNYKATILHKSNDGKFLVIGTDDGELLAFEFVDNLKMIVDTRYASPFYRIPVYKQAGNPFTAGKSFLDAIEVEEVKLELFGFSVKAPLFRIGWSKLKKIWLVSDEVL